MIEVKAKQFYRDHPEFEKLKFKIGKPERLIHGITPNGTSAVVLWSYSVTLEDKPVLCRKENGVETEETQCYYEFRSDIMMDRNDFPEIYQEPPELEGFQA